MFGDEVACVRKRGPHVSEPEYLAVRLLLEGIVTVEEGVAVGAVDEECAALGNYCCDSCY